jgi:hypothetical protein
MKKLFVILFFLVNCTLFGQRQEIGRIYWEIRNLETPWEGPFPANRNRANYRTHELHFRSTVDESRLPPIRSDEIGAEVMADIAQIGVRSGIGIIINSCTGPKRPSHYVIKEKTDNSFIVQMPFTANNLLGVLRIFSNQVDPSPGNKGYFDDTVWELCNLYDNKIGYESLLDINHEEMYWTNNFDTYGYHRFKNEFIIYLK